MARGKSGRIVIEIEPNLKKALYTALTQDDSTLKEWFIKEAEAYLGSRFAKDNHDFHSTKDEPEE